MHALEGKIEDFPICEIIQIIGMGRKTGTLVIEGGREQVSIYFSKGRAVYANPVYQREHLGNILVKRGVVSRSEINEALVRQRKLNERGSRLRIGSILVSMGVLSKEQLSVYVAEQIKESIYLIMAEKTGTFKFAPGLDVSSGDIVIELNVEEIILEGTRLIDEWGIIKERLVDFGDVYSINASPSENDSIELTVDEWKILSLLDGRRSINDVIGAAKLSAFEVCKTIFDFVQLGLVKKSGDGIGKKPVESLRVEESKPGRGIIRKLINRIRLI